MSNPQTPKAETELEPDVEEILIDFDTWCNCGYDDCFRFENYVKAKQAINQLILEARVEERERGYYDSE